jgi:membrane protease subunit HflC
MRNSKIKINHILSGLVLCFVLLAGVLYSILNVVPQGNIGVLVHKDHSTFLNPGVHVNAPFATIVLVPTSERLIALSGFENEDGTGTNNFGILWQVTDVSKFWQGTEGDSDKIKALFKTAMLVALNTSSKNMAACLVSLKQNSGLRAAGVTVNQVLLTGQVLDDDQLKATYQNMQGLATTIAAGIVADGTKKAAAVRAQGDQSLINIEGQAASQAAAVVGDGEAQAIQINAPAYHKNPQLFKALVDARHHASSISN